MSDARREIFSRLQKRAAYSKEGIPRGHSLVTERLAVHQRGVLPQYTVAPLERFIAKVENVSGSVKCIKDITALASAVDEYLSAQNIEMKIVAAPSALFQQVKWPAELKIEYRSARSDDQTALTLAFAGIAETGSLILCSGEDTPTTLNFLPDNYICVLQHKDIHRHMEDGWDLLREAGRSMPRALNFITGPSRTADVEQTIQLGAHGPRKLHIIILGVE